MQEIDGYDSLVISSDTSDADNKMYRQMILKALHAPEPTDFLASGEINAKSVSPQESIVEPLFTIITFNHAKPEKKSLQLYRASRSMVLRL